jgi:hypothetical protein
MSKIFQVTVFLKQLKVTNSTDPKNSNLFITFIFSSPVQVKELISDVNKYFKQNFYKE